MAVFRIWGSLSGGYEEYYLLGYNAVECHLLSRWTLKMETICSSETSVDTQRTIRRATCRCHLLSRWFLAQLIFFDTEDWGDMFLRNIGWHSTNYMVCHLQVPPAFTLISRSAYFLEPEDGGDMFLRNVGWHSTDYTACRMQVPPAFTLISCSACFFRHWRWRRYVPPKLRVNLNGLHGVISQIMILLWRDYSRSRTTTEKAPIFPFTLTVISVKKSLAVCHVFSLRRTKSVLLHVTSVSEESSGLTQRQLEYQPHRWGGSSAVSYNRDHGSNLCPDIGWPK
jgi:hypothetical protein